MSTTPAEQDAMTRALALAATPGVPFGPNPRVGCVLLDDRGVRVAEGYHRGAGTPHAEAVALREAGAAARGATAVVTLEPCNHTGRTPPCSQALVRAGVRRVVFAQPDPNALAAGGAATLRDAGVDVHHGLLGDGAARLNRGWRHGLDHSRPFVTWKFATTLDGRSAAADGTSRWISSAQSRRDTHRLRALADVMLVGTGTVETDDPALTVRDDHDRAATAQPMRVVMGERELDPGRRVLDPRLSGGAPSLHLRTRDPHDALTRLFEMGRREVFLEGGPRLAAAFLSAAVVDEIVCYVAPVLLGSGRAAVGDLGIPTLAAALRPTVSGIEILDAVEGEGPDVRLILTPARKA